MSARTDQAERFAALHRGPDMLLLANAWDAGSARLIESLGAKATATTSAGLAWAAGYPDGDALPAEVLLAAVRAIARVISTPLTVDMEGGYSDDPAEVAALAAALAQAGAVGVNIEDGAGPPEALCAKIAALRTAVAAAGTPLFVNARIDVYLRGLAADGEPAFAEAERRMSLYAEAGCDGLFVPGPVEPAVIGRLAEASPRPLNVMARDGSADAATLRDLGVRRLSAGSAIGQAAMETTRAVARTFLDSGRTPVAAGGAPLSYGGINALFA